MSTMSSDSNREHGIEFGDLEDELRSIDYPTDYETIVEQYGNFELDLESDSTTVREALEMLGDREYESPEDVLFAIKNSVGGDAVGREGYTDRGGGEPDDVNDESF